MKEQTENMNDLSTSITQLESNNVNVQPSPPSRENLLRCQSCLKVFETMAGYMHHKEANEMCHFDEGETHVEAWENQLLKEWAIALKKAFFHKMQRLQRDRNVHVMHAVPTESTKI